MKIVVCIKQVPDTAEVKLDPKTNTLIREGVPSIINHDDKAGLETALQLREQVGGTVTVVCMGPPQADVALREALAMGADEAYLLSAREFGGSDTYATATILAAALRKIGFDLVITGRQAIDGDTAQVGPQIAEQLHIPQVSYAEALRAEGDHVIVQRQFEDRSHLLRVQLPCLVTALSELNQARYMSVGGIVDAYAKDVTVWGFEDLKNDLNPAFIGLNGSPTNVFQSFGKQLRAPGVVLSGLSADEAVDAIMQTLIQRHIILW